MCIYIYISVYICSSYRTLPSAIWEIFSEFLIFCNLFEEQPNMRNEKSICQNYTAQRAITTLLLNAC